MEVLKEISLPSPRTSKKNKFSNTKSTLWVILVIKYSVSQYTHQFEMVNSLNWRTLLSFDTFLLLCGKGMATFRKISNAFSLVTSSGNFIHNYKHKQIMKVKFSTFKMRKSVFLLTVSSISIISLRDKVSGCSNLFTSIFYVLIIKRTMS